MPLQRPPTPAVDRHQSSMNLDQYIEALRLLADPQAHLKYELEVPSANVPAELVCMWFDDLDAGMPSAGLAPSDASRLRAFSNFYASRVKSLPSDGGVAALHASPAWQEVMVGARTTLDHLDNGTPKESMQPDGSSGRR